jgi:SAM-dependent methyltransferase
MTESPQRRPHAALEGRGRRVKALKIERLMAMRPPVGRALRLLEIGCGSGAIAHYFATQSGFACDVDAIDVVDQRQVTEGYAFRVVDGVALPFEDACFDAIISNHVIEHVGERDAQCGHLAEIARTLRADGVAYLATPNRWQLVEPHYHLAFLSWLPRALRTPFLRVCGKGDYYDCEPLRMPELERLVDAVGLVGTNLCVPALRHVLQQERPGSLLASVLGVVPDVLLQRLRRWSPTHVYLLRRKAGPPR